MKYDLFISYLCADYWGKNGQFELGFYYENGYGVTKSVAEAVKWYRKAAEQGNEDAKKRLSELGY